MRLIALLLLAGCARTITIGVEAKKFSYEGWVRVLRHVDGEGRVEYRALSTADLEPFLAMLAEYGPERTPALFPTEADRLAYWINAYNAIVIHQVLWRWPIGSVADHKARFFYWTRYVVDGKARSLYSIENDVLRQRFADPRIHFAINCASGGCPRLPREPFQPDRLEEQLTRETDRFLGDPRNVEVRDGTLYLSRIFEWYAGDFPPDPATWVARRRAGIGIEPGRAVVYREYDWSLNAR